MLFERKDSSRRASKNAAWCLALAIFVAAPTAMLRPAWAQEAEATAAEAAPQRSPKEAYELGRKQFAAKDYANARANIQVAQDAGYKPGLFQPAPSALLRDIDKAEANAATAATRAEQQAAQRNAAQEKAARETEVRRAYQTGRDQYKKGNWAEARKNLEFARDNGYRPGFMEEAPASLLTKIEKGEADWRAKHPQAAVAMQETPATPETPARAAEPSAAPAAAAAAAAGNEAEQALSNTSNYERIRSQHRAFESQRKVEEARKAQAENRTDDALRLYSEAVELDPANQAAIAGRDEIRTIRGVGVTPSPALDRVEREYRVRREAIENRVNTALNDATTAIERNDFTNARAALDSARVARASDPNVFSREAIAGFDSRISAAQAELDRRQAVADDTNRRLAVEDAMRRANENALRAEQERNRTVAVLVRQARQLIEDEKWNEALVVIDQIRNLDPRNEYAITVRPFIKDKAMIQLQRRHREKFDEEWVKQFVATEEAKIPYFTIMSYNENWPDISRKRDKLMEAGEGSTDDQAIQALLDRRLPELNFNANSFSDVIDFFREVTGANIYVDWAALERASISKDAPVTARLRDIKFSKALELIFKNVSGEEEDRRLAYTIDEGVITISTKRELDKNVVTRQYDINDLLFVAPDFANAPQMSLTNTSSSSGGGGRGGGGGGGGGGGSQGLFGGAGGGQQQGTQQQQGATREEITDEIKKYIVDNVESTTWKDNGGEVGSISASKLRPLLLVTQTPENHRKIQRLLDDLRKSQAIQISIETRFITVQRNYLQDIGVDADFTFNGFYRNPTTGLPDPSLGRTWSDKWSTLGFDQRQVTDNSTFVDPTTGQVVSVGGQRVLDWASRVGNANVPGSLPSGDYPDPLVIRGSFLDNFTVNFLIRAVEANHSSTTLTAPRLTLFDGQLAYIVVATETAYVADLTPVVSSGAALFDPDPDTLESGIVLNVQATVSPDRKYVFMTLQPQLTRLRQLVSFPVSAVVTPTTTGTIGTPAAPQIITGQLQLPTMDRVEVRTSCSVPDGATLLLGGQTLAGETEREHGVPILSKIPFIKRLFTNRGNAQDEQILLILVKPTILIQRELENEQFPMLSSKVAN